MEQPHQKSDPAPALTRGLALLRRLETEGASRLETLAQATGWPKSSVSRLLRSLEMSGMVRRDEASRRYHALVRLIPAAPVEQLLRDAWAGMSDALAAMTGQTAELYRYDALEGNLVMIDRCEPEGVEVSVRARIGFVPIFDEFDALTQVILAFAPEREARQQGQFWTYQTDGGRRQVVEAEVAETLHGVRKQGAGVDLSINPYNVRRYAAPIRTGGGQLLGALSLAQVCGPAAVTPDERFLSQVRQGAATLEKALISSINPTS